MSARAFAAFTQVRSASFVLVLQIH
jgi:hypothetical protein